MPAIRRLFSLPDRRRTVQLLRKVHRWIAVFLALFLIGIALSGTVLQIIMTIYGDTGPRQAPGEPLWVAEMRDLAVTIHTGAFSGIAGVYVGAICGLGLLFFSVSGVWMFWELYRSRAAQGRTALFWQTRAGNGAVMRSLHRWITPLIGLFTLLLSTTSVSLDLYFARYDMAPLPPPRGASPAELAAVGFAGPPPGGRAWHDWSLSLHKLNFLGAAGHVLGIFIGLALALLVISGVWMYATLLLQRRKSGLTSWFW